MWQLEIWYADCVFLESNQANLKVRWSPSNRSLASFYKVLNGTQVLFTLHVSVFSVVVLISGEK